ncbi:unnamed protein product [Vitrella brassicaformis CCMP3155]|uniref:P-type domain-containing protein n=1 Tax=Vitrella brassicaformis (strain CCMP3155) TaxID=1169540 RepID=A0A0G4EAN4_VITBC|nr:unnamed protein product [Vitrella brassicaformis CCMP3155]|eukprot:CEL92703.1 unnamed protein product [Vitrella brassicaformis CCMP3155]
MGLSILVTVAFIGSLVEGQKDVQKAKSLYKGVRLGSISHYHPLTKNARGTCHMFPEPPSGKNGVWGSVALPNVGGNTFANGKTCGMCIEAIATHTNPKGGVPGPNKKEYPPKGKVLRLFVNNACADCYYKNQLDVSVKPYNQKGLFKTWWRAVDCNPGKAGVQIIFDDASSVHYIGVQPRNMPMPAIKTEYWHRNAKKWFNLKWKAGFFQIKTSQIPGKWPKNLIKPPLKLRITSLKGEKKIINAMKIIKGRKPVPVKPKVQFKRMTAPPKKGTCKNVPVKKKKRCGNKGTGQFACKLLKCCYSAKGKGPKCYKKVKK